MIALAVAAVCSGFALSAVAQDDEGRKRSVSGSRMSENNEPYVKQPITGSPGNPRASVSAPSSNPVPVGTGIGGGTVGGRPDGASPPKTPSGADGGKALRRGAVFRGHKEELQAAQAAAEVSVLTSLHKMGRKSNLGPLG